MEKRHEAPPIEIPLSGVLFSARLSCVLLSTTCIAYLVMHRPSTALCKSVSKFSASSDLRISNRRDAGHGFLLIGARRSLQSWTHTLVLGRVLATLFGTRLGSIINY